MDSVRVREGRKRWWDKEREEEREKETKKGEGREAEATSSEEGWGEQKGTETGRGRK